MRVLVTGGNGRLGRWAVQELRGHGHEVVSVDRHVPEPREPGVHYRQVEMGDLGGVVGAAYRCDALLHLAAIPAPYTHPDQVLFLNNVGATYNALQAAMLTGIRRSVIASSASAYGMAWARPTFPPRYVPLDEDHPFLSADPYALAKETDERTAAMFVRRCGMAVVALRFHWIALPGEARTRALVEGERPEWDATNLWGYVDIRDAARACRLALEAEPDGFHAVNITADDSLHTEPTEYLVRTHLPTTEIRSTLAGTASAWSNARAKALLGFTPAHSWRDEDEVR